MNAAVMVGQVWADNDWRARGRRVRVAEVGPTHAVCVVVANAPHSDSIGRAARIRLDRFRPTSTGYRLVSDVVA